MRNVLITVVIGVISLAIGLLFLPILQDAVDALTGTGMIYENTTTGSLIDALPLIVVGGLAIGSMGAFLFVKRGR